MSKILTALSGVALGVAAYTLGELVQKKRMEYENEDYGITDLLQEFINEEPAIPNNAQEK